MRQAGLALLNGVSHVRRGAIQWPQTKSMLRVQYCSACMYRGKLLSMSLFVEDAVP